VAVLRNQFDKAVPHYRESSRLAHAIGQRFAVALAQQNLALIDLALGRLPEAEDSSARPARSSASWAPRPAAGAAPR
jgi:hypothetical protein